MKTLIRECPENSFLGRTVPDDQVGKLAKDWNWAYVFIFLFYSILFFNKTRFLYKQAFSQFRCFSSFSVSFVVFSLQNKLIFVFVLVQFNNEQRFTRRASVSRLLELIAATGRRET